MPYQAIAAFSISVPYERGGASTVHLDEFFTELEENQVKLRAISGFVSGRRIRIFCLPKDVAKFRKFLKSAGVRAKEVQGFEITGEKTVSRAVNILHFISLSRFELRAFDGFGVSNKAGGIVWSEQQA